MKVFPGFLVLGLSMAVSTAMPQQQGSGLPSQDTAGSAYVEFYIPQDQWHGYCLPVDYSLTVPFTSLYINMERYDEPAHQWVAVPSSPGDTVLSVPMRGYRIWSGSQSTPQNVVGVAGHLNTGFLVAEVTNSPFAETGDGMNLVGNPYPSAVNWYMVGLVNVDPTLYVFSPAWNNYLFWNRVTNVHSEICRFIIPAMQGFFVHCSAQYPETGQVIMANSCRLHDDGQIYEGELSYDNILTINAYGNGFRDESFIWMSDTAGLGFDGGLDAVKIPGEEEAPQLFSIIEGGVHAALNVRPWKWPVPKADLGFRIGVAGTDTLVFSGTESFPDTVEIWLEDKQDQHFQLLNEDPEYIFTTSPEDDPGRFAIWFCQPMTAIGDPGRDPVSVWSFEGKVYVDLTRSQGPVARSLALYDLAGRKAFTVSLSGGILNVFSPGLTDGYYVALITSGEKVSAHKLFLKSG